MVERKKLGDWGEQYARGHLEQKGYRLVTQNWRCPAGELDLIMEQGRELVFVEVKTRRGRQSGTPEASITPTKLTQLYNVIEHYFFRHDIDEECDWRLDVVSVELSSNGEFLRCEHWEGIGADW